MEHDEWGLAYESVCDEIYADEIAITPNIYNKIAKVGAQMEFPPETWLDLEKLVAKKSI